MSSEKRILVVEDNHETLEFVRSILQLSNPDYRITGVPSAEEALFELRLGRHDLLITDLRLPGVGGIELLNELRRRQIELPIIVMTGYASSGQVEAEVQGVFRYFTKPLDTDGLLAAVRQALYAMGEATHSEGTEAIGRPLSVAGDRLSTLRVDTGAIKVLLADIGGQIIVDQGLIEDVVIRGLVPRIVDIIKSGLELAHDLNSDKPFTIQYQTGQLYDVYSANVGHQHVLVLFFDAQARRSRIGTIWVFAQRAIRDLLPLLPDFAREPTGMPPEQHSLSDDQPTGQQPVMEPALVTGEPGEIEQVTEVKDVPDQESAVVEAADSAGMVAEEDTAHLPDLGLDGLADVDLDLNAFWDDALDSQKPAGEGPTISWEEAISRGLISPELSDEE